MNAKAKGYVLGAIAAATYGMNPLFALPLYKAGMNPDSVLFFRYLFAIPVLGIMIKARGRNFKLKPNEIVPLILMGLLVSFSSLALFQSYNYMEAGIASTLLFVYPILVALIMAFVFKEKLTLQTIFCILLALGGIGLLYKSGDGTTLSLTGVLLVMASALSYAIYIVSVNRPKLKAIATLKLTFYVLLHRASAGTKKMFSAVYSSLSSGSAYSSPCNSWNFWSKRSLMYFRKMSPSTTPSYCEALRLPLRISAAFHIFSSKPMLIVSCFFAIVPYLVLSTSRQPSL